MIWTLAAKTTGVIMDEGEPSQLYRTLLLEQEQTPSQAVEILIAYYQMSEEEAQLVSREYHAKQAMKKWEIKDLQRKKERVSCSSLKQLEEFSADV